MTPGVALARIMERGEIFVRDGKIVVKSPVSPQEAKVLKEHKEQIMVLLNQMHASPMDYARDKIGFDGEIVQDLISEAEACGATIYLRAPGIVGLRNGAGVSDDLLVRLARAHERLAQYLQDLDQGMTEENAA